MITAFLYKNNISKILIAGFLIWLGGLTVSTVLSSIEKPFTLDETDITIRADEVLKRGPVIFNDGTHYFAHPPLYEYTAVLIFKLFGQDEIPLRSFGLFCHVLSALFLCLLVREVLADSGRLSRNAGTMLFLTLFFINPTLLQHSMSIDADTTEIMLFVSMFAYLFVKYEKLKGRAFLISRFWVMIPFALAFLSKEITPILTAVTITGFRIINREWKRLALDVLIVFGLGTLIAWTVWWIYCVFTSTDPLAFIKYTLIKKTPRALNERHLTNVFRDLPRMMRWPVYWAGAPLVILLVAGICSRMEKAFKDRKFSPLDSSWILGIGIFTPYVIAKPTIDMMKYQHPAFGLFIAFISIFIAQRFMRSEDRHISWLNPGAVTAFILLSAVLTAYYWKVGDYILLLWERGMTDKWADFLKNYYLPFGVLLISCGLIKVLFRKKFYSSILICLIALLISVNSALNMRQHAPYTTAESWMNYGEYGHFQVVDFLNQNLKPKDFVTIRKDLRYYMETHHGHKLNTVEIRKIMATQDRQALMKVFLTGQPRYIIWDKIELLGFTPEIMRPAVEVMSRFYRLALHAGSFKIYELAR